MARAALTKGLIALEHFVAARTLLNGNRRPSGPHLEFAKKSLRRTEAKSERPSNASAEVEPERRQRANTPPFAFTIPLEQVFFFSSVK